MEAYTSGTGQALKVHDLKVCSALRDANRWCVIHRRKPGHMQAWPTNWRSDAGFMEVLCPHGIGHPAPEDRHQHMHGCDGCCQAETVLPDGSGVRYRIGGLMRCCIQTLIEADMHWAPADARVDCRFCRTSMVLRDGAFEWDKSRANPYGNVPVPPEAEMI